MVLRILFILYCTSFSLVHAQLNPIFLDGRTDDWHSALPTYVDTENDGAFYDFKDFSATNNEEFLFIKLKITPFVKLIEDNQLSIFIDGDDNPSTGYSINGIGAELRFNLGSRTGFNYHTNSSFSHSSIKFRSLPTVTDTVFEIAIGRTSIPPFNGTGTIKIQFVDFAGSGDWMPNTGEFFSYTFNEEPTPALTPVELDKADTSFLRIMNWNVYNDGLLNPNREQMFKRILQAIKPDIIAFNEMWNSTALQVQAKLNSILPLQSGSWNAIKLDGGNITASRYPILQNWQVYPGQRITASLIDLPQRFEKDFLIINCHYRCCGGAANDATRQREADATIAFILDAKTPGGVITLPENTPFVITGDLNLVGERQQLVTLLTGEIINTQLFGNGAPPDWDSTELEDIISMHSDKRTAYTWRNDQSTFSPGRLDFQIFSNSIVKIEKHFILQTDVMTQERLSQYGLLLNDSKSASDHFPKVSDISFVLPSKIEEKTNDYGFLLEQNYPNPFNPATTISYSLQQSNFVSLKMYDILGNNVATLVNEPKSPDSYEITFNASDYGLSSGIYFYRLQAGDFTETRKLVIVR
jgi:hypothetical protein